MSGIVDPIADMLIRIVNAQKAKHETVMIPASKVKESIAKILFENGFIRGYKVEKDNKQNTIIVELKYVARDGVIKGVKRISKPGRRVYKGYDQIPRVLNGLGIAIVSTSKGIMSDKNAKKNNVGGEILCYIW
ncbi:MAG TPA: 30S ribosomal protein S8 [Firmicutes bacterium]|uniref:Small ribosomal subunit protein uS8 n=1 Tax=candidate division TA06 bacterium TaxID=2250710 RepID=A0A660S4X8_UNCT6|nr:30S ribosomal protein S8 [candidate division WOR-3 bacterium]RKX64692.1 MAG: 30S ribosomal protein S8 [candidate division TA06 bacterium]HFD05203.1 30S ribosomal protein S8 [Bacillota bacterium]